MKNLYFVLTIFSVSTSAIANCEFLKNPNDVLKCVMDNHISLKLGQAEVSKTNFLIEEANQRLNPEFNANITKNRNSDFTSELSLIQTFELGGKRSARTKVAKSKLALTQLNLLKKREEVIIQTVIDLYRVRQINHEKEVVKEIIETFRRVKQQYSKAGRLSPEDKVSISIFNMSLEDSKLKLNILENEMQEILSRIESETGKQLMLTSSLLPQIKRDWGNITSSEINGSAIKEAFGKLEVVRAIQDLEESGSWSDLNIGPTFEVNSGYRNDYRFGIGVGIALPIFHRNDARKAVSRESVKIAELEVGYLESRLIREKKYLYSVYENVSKTITKTLSNKKINLKHRNLHKMTTRGVIPASLIIELHRQIMDYYENLHKKEIQGVEAFWRILALEGRILEEKLK